MSDEYTPTFELIAEGSAPVPETPETERYGSGLDHDHEAAMRTNAMAADDTAPSSTRTGPAAFGEERHPGLFLGNQPGDVPDELRYHAELPGWTLCGCHCTCTRVVVEGSIPFPPETELELLVFGTRHGDTGRVPVTVVDASPLTLSVDDDCPALWRLMVTGCLLCEDEEE